MKRKLAVIAMASILAACSTTKPAGTETTGPMTPINAQHLNTTFKRQGVKIEWDCSWYQSNNSCENGDIKSIEVTAYAPSYGNSEGDRENAFTVAEIRAKAKLRHFIYEDVNSQRTVHTLAKNVEKANDKLRGKVSADEVAITDDDADKEANTTVRTNANDTARTLTETIRVQAQGILKGVYVKDEQIVDRQTVQVTIRWDKSSENASTYFQKKFK
jgi:hypothetical protein